VPDDADGLTEENTAGFISPRSMVAAQTMLAANASARIVREEARAIRPSSIGVDIEPGNSTVVSAERVLIAAGVFTDLCGLSPIEFGLTVFGRTTVFARIESALAHALVGMPTLIHRAMGAHILPPIAK
jgi:sarcosine oxidase